MGKSRHWGGSSQPEQGALPRTPPLQVIRGDLKDRHPHPRRVRGSLGQHRQEAESLGQGPQHQSQPSVRHRTPHAPPRAWATDPQAPRPVAPGGNQLGGQVAQEAGPAFIQLQGCVPQAQGLTCRDPEKPTQGPLISFHLSRSLGGCGGPPGLSLVFLTPSPLISQGINEARTESLPPVLRPDLSLRGPSCLPCWSPLPTLEHQPSPQGFLQALLTLHPAPGLRVLQYSMLGSQLFRAQALGGLVPPLCTSPSPNSFWLLSSLGAPVSSAHYLSAPCRKQVIAQAR